MSNQFTKESLKAIPTVLQQQLDTISPRLKLKITVGNCHYEGAHATFKVDVAMEGAKSREETDLDEMAQIYDLDLTKFHPIYKLVGYRRKARTRPFIVTKHGKSGRYIISVEQAQSIFGKSPHPDQKSL